MGDTRGRNPAHVCRADGLRSAKLPSQAMDQRGETKTCVLHMVCGDFFGRIQLLMRNINTEMNGKGYGMPSSHAQFVAFYSISLALFLLFRHVPKPSATHRPTTFLERVLLSAMSLLCAAAVSASRVYLNYHTPKQVLAGCAAGAVSALAWFLFTTALRRLEWIPWALDTELARMFRMRDLVVEEDLVEAGWQRWEARRTKETGASNGIEKKAR